MEVELVGALSLLPEPVRRDAVLGRVVHLAGADLDLVRLAGRAEHGRVERLVPVGLGARDVVLDALLERRPLVVDDPEHVVALGNRRSEERRVGKEYRSRWSQKHVKYKEKQDSM